MEACYAMLVSPALNGPGSKSSFLISEKLINLTLLNRVVQECANDKFYHKIMVFAEEEYRRDLILKTLLNFVEPLTFSPILFQKEGNSCTFFVKSCQDLLLKLITAKFIIKIPNKGEKYLKFRIICNFIPVEALEVVSTNNLSDVLKTRYKESTKTLDLSSFCDDESLLEYCPLYLSRNMIAVMAHISNYHPKKLNLQHNHLRDITTIYSLQKDLESLDLRHNQIQSLKDLACLKYFTKLKTLYLDGNPLCALYDNFNYVIEIKSLCSSLQFIDGEKIVSPPGYKKNLLCRLESQEFADLFMKLFFTQYDSDNRETLRGLYDKNALFSVSATVVPHEYSKDIDLNHYGLKDPFLVYGVEEIMQLFQELPKTRHYPYQFTCDVTLYECTHAAISISGVYWEYKQFISFTRNFLLKRNGDKFAITNEQLIVMNATKSQSDRSITQRDVSHFPYLLSEYGKMELALGKLTNMNRKYCQIFLYNCQYDMNKALQVFCESYINGRIPSDVFAADRTTSNDDVSSFSDLIVQEVSKTSQTITERSVWKIMEMKRLKRCLHHEQVKNSSVKKFFHMHSKSSSDSSSGSKPFKTLEKPKNIKKLKPICFKLSAPSVVNNKRTDKKKETNKEKEEAIKENTKMGDKNKEPKSSRIVNSNSKVGSTRALSKKDRQAGEGNSSRLKSKASDEILENDSGSKRKKRKDSDSKGGITDINKVTDDKNKLKTFKLSLSNNTAPVKQPESQRYLQNRTNTQVNKSKMTKTINYDTKQSTTHNKVINDKMKNKVTNKKQVETVKVQVSNVSAPVVQPEYQQYLQNANSAQVDPQTYNYYQFQPQYWGAASFQQPMFSQNNPYMYQPQSSMPLQFLPQSTFQSAQNYSAQQPVQFEECYYSGPFVNTDGLTAPQLGDANLYNESSLVPPGTEDSPGDVLQPETIKKIQPVQTDAVSQEKGVKGIEKMLHTIIRQLKGDNQTVTVGTDASIYYCVKRMLSFIEQLENSYKINGGNRTVKHPVMIKKIIHIGMDEDLAFSILHVILHEMFEYESCKYDHSKINVNISDEVPLCSNKIYLSKADLLSNIREKLCQNQNVFGILRFKTEPSPVECGMKDNQLNLPYILRVHNKFDVLHEILKKAIEGSKGAVHSQELAAIKIVAQHVLTYFTDSTNLSVKRRLIIKKVVNTSPFQKGIKGVFTLTAEALVHIIIHEFIENSICSNNNSKDFLKISNLPPICHNTIYWQPFKSTLDDIRCLLRQAELKQKLLYESKLQENPKMLSSFPQETTLQLTVGPVPFTELFNDILIEICLKNSIGTQQTLVDECNLPFLGRTIASLVQYLDKNHSKKVNDEFLNGIVRLLDSQEPVNDTLSPKRYLIHLTKSIIHVTIHEMFEYMPCNGYVPLPPKLLQVLKSLNENVPTEKLLCQDDIYQKKNEPLRMSIRECLSKVEHHFKNLKLTAQPFISIFPIYNLAATPSAPVAKPVELGKTEDNSNQRKAEVVSNHKKTEDNSNKGDNSRNDVSTIKIIDLTIEKQVSQDNPTHSTSARQIHIDKSVRPRNYDEIRASVCKPLTNVVNIEKHLLGKNVNKTIIVFFLKMIGQQTNSWPREKDRQAAVELFDALAESFILNVQDLTGNSTIQKGASNLKTKDNEADVSLEIIEPEVEIIDLCEPDPDEIWISNKLGENYNKSKGTIITSKIFKMYKGLLHVVTHEILEKSTCTRNKSGNSKLRSVICSDHIYKFLKNLYQIRTVIYEGENILRCGSIPLKEDVIVLSPKKTFLFGFVPENTFNLEVYLLKHIFTYIIGKFLLKFFFRHTYLNIWQDLDELTEKMTFVMQHYYNISLAKGGFAIGELNATLRRNTSPFLFQLVVGMLHVLGNDCTIAKKRLSKNMLVHKKLSIGSCHLPGGPLLRRFIYCILNKNMHLFPSWLEFAKDNVESVAEVLGHKKVLEGGPEKLDRIIRKIVLSFSNDFTPEDSSLVNHFAEKISCFLKSIKLVNPALPLTDTFYECVGIICPQDGPSYAQLITSVSQMLVHFLTYHCLKKERQLKYNIDKFYENVDKKMFLKMKSCFPWSVVTPDVNVLRNWMEQNWNRNVGKVLEVHLESTKQSVKPVGLKRKRILPGKPNITKFKKIKLCVTKQKKCDKRTMGFSRKM